jgi:hypothetical protein
MRTRTSRYNYIDVLKNSTSNVPVTQNAWWQGLAKTYAEICGGKPIYSLDVAKTIYGTQTTVNDGMNDNDVDMGGDSDHEMEGDDPENSSNYVITKNWRSCKRPWQTCVEAAIHANADFTRFYAALSIPKDNEM